MLKTNQERTNGANAPKMVIPRISTFTLIEETPEDFLLGVGVLVAVKNPVRTSVLVVTVTLVPRAAVDDAVDVAELQSEEAS